MEITRFEIPKEIIDVINFAVENNLIDAVEIYCLAVKFQNNWKELVTDLCEIAFATIHDGTNRHSDFVKVAEKYWQTTNQTTNQAPANVRSHQFGCRNCLWASAECVSGSKYAPHGSDPVGCAAYVYFD